MLGTRWPRRQRGPDMRGPMGALESVARHGGFTDVLPRGTEADGHVTIEAAGEYRQSWLLTGRTYGDAAFLGSLADAQRAALAAIGPALPGEGRVRGARRARAPDGATAGHLVEPGRLREPGRAAPDLARRPRGR